LIANPTGLPAVHVGISQRERLYYALVWPAEVQGVQYTHQYSKPPVSETDIEVNQFEAWNRDQQIQCG
jgi:hypothetical protein